MLLLQWSEWPEPEAAGEQGVWQSCDIMTSNNSCGWKVCWHPPSQKRHGKGERLRERERKLAGKCVQVRSWERRRCDERERECDRVKERGWQRETGRQSKWLSMWKRRELCKRARRPLSTWQNQTRTVETHQTLLQQNLTLIEDLESLTIMSLMSKYTF